MTEIIRGDASHIDALEPLWNAMREHHASLDDQPAPVRDREDSWTRRREHYVGILDEGGALFLAMDDGDIVGHAICEQEEGGGSPTWSGPPSFLALVDLSVLPDRRRDGIGERLMEAVEAEARERGVAALDLMVAGPNEGARRFYERLGFRPAMVNYRKMMG